MQQLAFVSVVLLACTAAAQNRLGVFRNNALSFTTRGGVAANANAAVTWNRIDSDKYAAWGCDDTRPGMRVFSGLRFLIQDENTATQDSFTLVVFGESTATPNFPATATPLATTGNFLFPLGTGGAAAFDVTANFATPVQAPAANDVYVGIGMNAPWLFGLPSDGLSTHALAGAGFPSVHRPGFGMPTTPADLTTFGGYFVPSTATLAYSTSLQFLIEPITSSASGVCSALEIGQMPPGASNMFSGLYPDARNPPRNAGRADDVGMTFLRAGLANGTPVFFLAEIGPAFGAELPLSSMLPGSSGNVCLNLGSAQTIALATTTGGVATNVIVIPAGVRGAIAGISLLHQAAALDVTSNAAHAGPCSKQIL